MLLDTSGLLSLHDMGDLFHRTASHYFQTVQDRLVHNYVLSEWIALANARGVLRATALQVLMDLQDHPDIDVVWVDESLHRAATNLLLARPDKSYSLCDAVSFVLMRDRNMQDALTTDRHFEQEGFRRLLK